MNETGYQISEAAKRTQVEAHVLRYWEEELALPIGRNEMGHRYYTEKDIQTFLYIKELKKKGLQLRAIREKLQQEEQETELKKTEFSKKEFPEKELQKVCEEKRQDKPKEKTKEERFGEIMERLIRSIERSERKEGRYRRLDEAIRRRQQSRKMVAATEEHGKRKNRKKKEI